MHINYARSFTMVLPYYSNVKELMLTHWICGLWSSVVDVWPCPTISKPLSPLTVLLPYNHLIGGSLLYVAVWPNFLVAVMVQRHEVEWSLRIVTISLVEGEGRNPSESDIVVGTVRVPTVQTQPMYTESKQKIDFGWIWGNWKINFPIHSRNPYSAIF